MVDIKYKAYMCATIFTTMFDLRTQTVHDIKSKDILFFKLFQVYLQKIYEIFNLCE
jgi:hypothetical protein